jgi:tetratricopeptide (TPR) repeat protein
VSPRLESMFSKAQCLASSGDVDAAIAIVTELTVQHPDEARVWSLQGHLFAIVHDYTRAVSDLSKAIAIAPREPKLFFDRGRYYLRLEQYSAAIDDFSRGLALCDERSSNYYCEALLFLRAEALLQSGRTSEALTDLKGVREDFTMWTNRLASKKGLVGECLRKA